VRKAPCLKESSLANQFSAAQQAAMQFPREPTVYQ